MAEGKHEHGPDNDGIRLEIMEGDMGRVLVATTDFLEIGSILLRETPLIVWEKGGDQPRQQLDTLRMFLESYVAAGADVQELINDMFHPDLRAPQMQAHLPAATLLAQVVPSLHLDQIHKLIVIANTNAHAYSGVSTEVYAETIGGAAGSPKVALFHLGSKVAHSCLPTAAYTSKTADGMLEYKSIRPIKASEQITFSYMGDLFTTTTQDRRELLLREKSFICHCIRCDAKDFTRALPCPRRMSCHNFVLLDGRDQTGTWSCSTCGDVTPSEMRPILRVETQFMNEFSDRRNKMMNGIESCNPDDMSNFVQTCARALSPTHFVALKAVDSLATLCASHAHLAEQCQSFGISSRFGSPESLRVKSAKACLHYSSMLACVAAGCLGSSCSLSTTTVHANPVYEGAKEVFFAAQDLIKVSPRMGDTIMYEYIQRSAVFIKIMFGSTDKDVMNIEAAVADALAMATRVTCEFCDKLDSEDCPHRRCARCHTAIYCSRSCQRAAWKSHKKGCGKQAP